MGTLPPSASDYWQTTLRAPVFFMLDTCQIIIVSKKNSLASVTLISVFRRFGEMVAISFFKGNHNRRVVLRVIRAFAS